MALAWVRRYRPLADGQTDFRRAADSLSGSAECAARAHAPRTVDALGLRVAAVAGGELAASIVDIDRFGNLGLNVSSAEIAAVGLEPGQTVELRFALTPYYAELGETYADTGRGELILYEDSYGAWAIAINGGNAAALTEATVGDEVRISAVSK